MKITIESLKKIKCKEVLHSLCPTDLHVPEKIILLCFLIRVNTVFQKSLLHRWAWVV